MTGIEGDAELGTAYYFHNRVVKRAAGRPNPNGFIPCGDRGPKRHIEIFQLLRERPRPVVPTACCDPSTGGQTPSGAVAKPAGISQVQNAVIWAAQAERKVERSKIDKAVHTHRCEIDFPIAGGFQLLPADLERVK